MFSKKFICHLGRNLQFLRRTRQLRQQDMQLQLELSRGTWSNYERGRSEPTLEGLLKIAAYFGIGLDELVLRDLEKEARKKSRSPYRDDEGVVSVKKWEFDYIRRELEWLLEEVEQIRKKTGLN